MSSLPHPEPVTTRLRPIEPARPPGRPRTALDPDYDYPTCREFAANLSDPTIVRAAEFFGLLAERGTADAEAMSGATAIRVRDLAGQLTAPLRRHADSLGLPLPFILEAGADPAARRWHDRAGIAGRMLGALRDERASRPAFAAAGVAGAYRRQPAVVAPPIRIPIEPTPVRDPHVALATAFAPLVALLGARPGDSEITLTFGQIEAIIGGELPPIARRQAGWWTDSDGPGTAALWHELDRNVATNMDARSVTFIRTDPPVRQLVPAEVTPAPVTAPEPLRPPRRARRAQPGRVVGRLVHGLVHPHPAAHAGDS